MFAGEIAALGAAFGFSVTSVCYTLAGRRINAMTSTAVSLPIAWLLIMLIHRVVLGEFLPTGAAPERWLNLGISGFLAFVCSSYFVLNAYQYIGPRLTMLIMSFAPVMSAILAWVFLGQALPAGAVLGIAVVVCGIVWVVAERGAPSAGERSMDLRRGVLFASLGTITQAMSFVFASQGMAGGFAPLSATLIRIGAGITVTWLLLALQGRLSNTLRAVQGDRTVVLQLLGAAITGPVLSASLLLVSFQYIPVGVATTLSHTTSIILIPIGYFLFRERITARALIGTVVTVLGIAILFIDPA